MNLRASFRFGVALAVASALTTAVGAADQGKSLRHLVYNFDATFSTTSTVHDSGIGGGPVSGSADYRAGTSDQGQILVDVQQVQPDSGIVLQIQEVARGSRSSPPTTCVVYGTGNVICDESKGGPNEEEMSLLRLLGRNFVDQAVIDKNHWQYAQSSPDAKETNDYTITKNDNGMLSISMQRVLKVQTGQPFDATTDGNITYNQKLSVPVSLKEDTITRRNTGGGNYDRMEQQFTLDLTADSMQQTASSH